MSDEGLKVQLHAFVAKELMNGKSEGLDEATPLLEWGLIDSIAIVSLLAFIDSQFGVKVPTSQLVPANLRDIRSIAALVSRLRGNG